MKLERYIAIFPLFAVLTAQAQTPTPLARSVEVTVTNLDIVVTDSKGKPVTDLTAGDFEVKQDGALQNVTNLSFIRNGAPAGEPMAAPATGAPGTPSAPAPASPAPRTPTVHLVAFIDELHLTATDRNRALRSLAEYLPKTTGPNVEIRIMTWNRTLKMRGSFTNDAAAADAALKSLEKETAFGDTILRERNDILQQIDMAFDAPNRGPGLSSVMTHTRAFCEAQVNDVETTLKAAQAAFSQLAGLEGRKIMFFLTQRFAPAPGREVLDYLVRRLQQRSRGLSSPGANELTWKNYDRSRSFSELADAANAARVSLVTIEGSGLTTDPSFSAEYGGMSQKMDEGMATLDADSALLLLADQTGGAAVIGQNNLALALERLESDWKSYYSLGFESARPKPGESHRISVSVKRPGLNVRSRRSIFERTPEQKIADAVLSFIHFPKISNPLRATLDIGKPEKSGNLFLVPIEFKIPFEKLALIPEGGVARGRILFTAAAAGSDGRISEISTQRFPVEIPEAELASLAGKSFTYSTKLKTRPGAQILSLAITDEISQQTSYVQPRTTIGEVEGRPGR